MPTLRKNFLKVGLLALLMSACIGKLDWQQGEDFEARPVWTFDLFYAQLAGDDFYVANQPVTELNDTIPMRVFKIKQIKDGLQKLVFYFDVTNPLPTRLAYRVDWAWENHGIITSFADTIEAGTPSHPFRREFVYTIIKDSLPDIVLTDQMYLHLQRLDTTDLRQLQDSLRIRAKGDFYALIQ